MVRVKPSFVESFLFNRLLEAIKPLNQVIDALEPEEQELIGKIQNIIRQITGIEI